MFLIAGIQVNRKESYAELDGCKIDLDKGLISKSTGAIAILEPIYPTTLDKWWGFEANYEGDISFFVLDRDSQVEFNFNGQEWEEGVDRVFLSAKELRDRISKWQGKLQIGIRFNTPGSLFSLRIGFYCLGDFVDYLFRFFLPKFFRITAKRYQTMRITGNSIPIPDGVEISKISEPRIKIIGSGKTYNLTINIAEKAFTIPVHLTSEVAYLNFDYPLSVDPDNQSIPQIETIPCAFFRNLESTQVKEINATASILVSDSRMQVASINRTCDMSAEIVIFASNQGEARSYASEIASKIVRSGTFFVPGYGYEIGIFLLGGIQNGPIPFSPSGEPSNASLYSSVVKFRLSNVPFQSDTFASDVWNIELNTSVY